jgi:hypothetical protein
MHDDDMCSMQLVDGDVEHQARIEHTITWSLAADAGMQAGGHAGRRWPVQGIGRSRGRLRSGGGLRRHSAAANGSHGGGAWRGSGVSASLCHLQCWGTQWAPTHRIPGRQCGQPGRAQQQPDRPQRAGAAGERSCSLTQTWRFLWQRCYIANSKRGKAPLLCMHLPLPTFPTHRM